MRIPTPIPAPVTQEIISETQIQGNSINQPAVGVKKQQNTIEYTSAAETVQFHRDTCRARSVILDFFYFNF